MNDLSTIPANTHDNSILSLIISNTSLSSYKKSSTMKHHFNILYENSKIQRLDLDFTQFKFRNGILSRILALVSHVRKHHQYNVFLSLTIPVDKNFKIPDEFLALISKFHTELISFNMINILITKDLKPRHSSWFDIVLETFSNVSQQLRNLDSNNEIFIGSIYKYLAFTFDCDVIPDSTTFNSYHLTHSVKTAVKHTVIHGERKNMTELELLKIWQWATNSKIGQIQIKSYLTNSKNIKTILEKNQTTFNNNHQLKLPMDLMIDLADEVSTTTPSNSRSSSIIPEMEEALTPKLSPTLQGMRSLPDYETAMLEKMTENELENGLENPLIKLPSYRTIAE